MGVEEFKLPYGLTLMILQYFFPLTVLIFTYSRIAVAVWGKKSLGEAEDSRDQRLAKTKRKVRKKIYATFTRFKYNKLYFFNPIMQSVGISKKIYISHAHIYIL